MPEHKIILGFAGLLASGKGTSAKYLEKKYGLIEEDLVSAELELVPAEPARDVGLDRGIIGAYGQDDRACVFSLIHEMQSCSCYSFFVF